MRAAGNHHPRTLVVVGIGLDLPQGSIGAAVGTAHLQMSTTAGGPTGRDRHLERSGVEENSNISQPRRETGEMNHPSK